MIRQNNRSFFNNLSQPGFTLIEMAIVLLIIALLIGGVLKGQEMVRQAKVKKLEKIAEEVRTAVGAYYRSQGKLPGDSDNDGWLNNVNGEKSEAFKDLVDQNLITGGNTTADQKQIRKHPWGDFSLTYQVYGSYKNNFIVFYGLPTDVITALDTKYDDGNADAGAVRSSGTTLYLPL